MVQHESTQLRRQSQEANRITLRRTKYPHIFDVELRLPLKTVFPGRLDFSGEGIFCSKRKPDHVHRNSGGWGVNAELLERFKFKWISITCDGREYTTSRDVILRFGQPCTYKGYEKQWFLRKELWGLDAVQQFEREEAKKPQQLGLFEVTA
jgi:hypothetical protein